MNQARLKSCNIHQLLPAMIAAEERLLGTADPVRVGHALRLTWFGFATALIPVLYTLARKYLRPGFAFCVVLAWLFNADWAFLNNLCFAEVPFTLLGVLFLWWLRATGRFAGGLAGASAVASYSLRSSGIAMLLL
jgi:hypothetical protein